MEKSSFKELFGIKHRVEVRINLTNVCNLHCDFCDHDAHLPFSKDSIKVYRRKPLVSSLSELKQLCESLKGIGESDRHVLQGGEITVLPVKTIIEVIEIFHSYGRNIGMRTNGYNLKEIPVDSLNKLNFIYLNNHGNNQEAIDSCQDYLSINYKGIIINEENYYHRDLSKYLHHNEGTIEEGINCSHLLSTITFFPPIIHPCCNSWALMNSLNDKNMADLLIEAGWTTTNSDLSSTLQNWRSTLPKEFFQSFCAESCYLTAKTVNSPLQKIKSYESDKILKK
jgi:organic radical activating enzyme